jgi:hypothetical protein
MMIYRAEVDADAQMLATAIRTAVKALIENDLTAIAAAQKHLLTFYGGDRQALHMNADKVIITSSSMLIEYHCIHCGMLEEQHIDRKCLFDASQFTPCNNSMAHGVLAYWRANEK